MILSECHDCRYAARPTSVVESNAETQNLPDEVILFMLGRESLLTDAKMMNIDFEKYKLDRELRSLKVQMRQVQALLSVLSYH